MKTFVTLISRAFSKVLTKSKFRKGKEVNPSIILPFNSNVWCHLFTFKVKK